MASAIDSILPVFDANSVIVIFVLGGPGAGMSSVALQGLYLNHISTMTSQEKVPNALD